MFSKNGYETMVAQDHTATYNNLKLVLMTSKNSLLGDPDFGSNLKRRLFEQNNAILRDLVIDDVYSAIITFMPQLSLKRNDINVESDGVDIYVTIKCTNLIDYELDTYVINLTE
jgi:phage baseplate assembly protein W